MKIATYVAKYEYFEQGRYLEIFNLYHLLLTLTIKLSAGPKQSIKMKTGINITKHTIKLQQVLKSSTTYVCVLGL
jgi:hypothetical protein